MQMLQQQKEASYTKGHTAGFKEGAAASLTQTQTPTACQAVQHTPSTTANEHSMRLHSFSASLAAPSGGSVTSSRTSQGRPPQAEPRMPTGLLAKLASTAPVVARSAGGMRFGDPAARALGGSAGSALFNTAGSPVRSCAPGLRTPDKPGIVASAAAGDAGLQLWSSKVLFSGSAGVIGPKASKPSGHTTGFGVVATAAAGAQATAAMQQQQQQGPVRTALASLGGMGGIWSPGHVAAAKATGNAWGSFEGGVLTVQVLADDVEPGSATAAALAALG
jgi:hypothetical protein